MKVDRNQDVRPMLVALSATTRNGEVRETYTNEGGIPLRLHIASLSMASEISRTDGSVSNMNTFSEWHLKLADALIAAHNETCEVDRTTT